MGYMDGNTVLSGDFASDQATAEDTENNAANNDLRFWHSGESFSHYFETTDAILSSN